MNASDPISSIESAELREAGFVFTSVAGYHFYPASCHYGEFVHVVREPDNCHDVNAFLILNSAGVQIGHLPRDVAFAFAELVDRNDVALLGRVARPGESGFDSLTDETRPCLVVWVYEDALRRPFSGFPGVAPPEPHDDPEQAPQHKEEGQDTEEVAF